MDNQSLLANMLQVVLGEIVANGSTQTGTSTGRLLLFKGSKNFRVLHEERQVPKFQAVDEYTSTSLSIAGKDLLFATHCPSLSSHPPHGYHFSNLLAELHI